jgi:hypothetical protein
MNIDGNRHALSLVWALCCAVLIFQAWTSITTRAGWDPDDQLRLVQLRDFLNGQSWFDVTQYRLNAPDGAPMHWSRLVELPLALLVLIFRPLFGQPVAEMIAGTMVPLLLLGAIMYMLARISEHIASREAGVLAAVMAGMSMPLLMQLRPMRIDHHGWQIAMSVLALWTLFWPGARRAGAVSGVALAVWLHISLEGAPMSAAFFVFLGWRWIGNAFEATRLRWTVGGFASASALLFIGTQAEGLFASAYCDTISPPHIWATGFAAAVMLPATRFAGENKMLRLAAVFVAAAGALALLAVQAPACLNGAFGNLDPLVRAYWYANVKEGLPIWHQDARTALALSAGAAIGVVSWLMIYRDAKPGERSRLLNIGFFAVYSFLLSLLVFRTISVAAAYAIPATAAYIMSLFHRYRAAAVPARRVTLVAVMLFLLVPGAIINSAVKVVAGPEKPELAKAEKANNACESVPSVAALGALPRGNFIAPFDMGPTILAQTGHKVLASSHHRNERAMRDHIEIFRSPPDIAHRLMKTRGIDYLAACPKESELRLYAKKDPAGLWGNISRGDIPDWLEPLPDTGKGIKLWRVR